MTATLQQLQEIKTRLQHELVERKRAEEALIESEAKYRELVEHQSDAVMLIDAETLKFEDDHHECTAAGKNLA